MSETSFADFIQESRERKKKQALAQEILGRGRKANGAGSLPNARNGNGPQKPSLASRMSSSSGVSKSRSSSAKPAPPANINGKWQHDLHDLNNPSGPPSKRLNRTVSASQIDRNTRTFNKFRSVLQENAPAQESTGFSIKGVAAVGPFTVYATNFAPGTTAADIEAVMSPVAAAADGELLSCKLVSSDPTVMVELVVDRLDAANKIIAMFNGQKADGRVLYVYIKEPMATAPRPRQAPARQAPRAVQPTLDDMDIDVNGGARNGSYQDGGNRSGGFQADRPRSGGYQDVSTRNGSFQDGRFGFSETTHREPPRGPRRRY